MTLQTSQLDLPLLGDPPNLKIKYANDCHGQVEGHRGGDQRYVLVGKQKLHLALVVLDDPVAEYERPADYEGRPHEHRYGPAESNKECDLFGGPVDAVGQRTRDRKVAVKRNEQQTSHACIAHRVVQTEPQVADVGAQQPLFGYEIQREDGHRIEADYQVRNGQAYEEVIVGRAQLFVDPK